MAANDFHQLKVASLRRETSDAVRVGFEVPTALHAQFAFRPGQYLTLKSRIAGQDVRRSYSICSGLNDGELNVAIKALDGGQFSTWANQDLKVGDAVWVMPPAGNFTPELDPASCKHYLCIAAGSGITPILSIIKSILDVEPESRVSLLYGNQKVSTIMFRDELDQLKNQHMQRFQLTHVLSQEQRDVPILNGRINNRKGAELCRHLLDLNAVDEFYLCGPESMISEVSRGLRDFGIADQAIHYELFGASADDAAKAIERHHARAEKFAGKVSRVTVRADGRETSFELSPDGENILDAALQAGLDLPYACKGGACATCRAKVIRGEVEMDVAHALVADDIAAGYVLSCQAHPLSDELMIDFD